MLPRIAHFISQKTFDIVNFSAIIMLVTKAELQINKLAIKFLIYVKLTKARKLQEF